MKRTRLILNCALLLALLFTVQAVAARSTAGYDLSWNTLFSGSRAANAGYTLEMLDSARFFT